MDRRFRWAAVLAAVLVAALVGIVSFNAGVSHGLAIGASSGGASATAPFGPYGWYRPWGFGFFGPFVFVLFWFLVFRLLFWGGFYRHRWHNRGPYDLPPAFDEWHRRAHDRMNGQAKSPAQGNA